MNAPDNRPTKNEKRQDAREKARSMREAQNKRSKRNKVWPSWAGLLACWVSSLW